MLSSVVPHIHPEELDRTLRKEKPLRCEALFIKAHKQYRSMCVCLCVLCPFEALRDEMRFKYRLKGAVKYIEKWDAFLSPSYTKVFSCFSQCD